MTVDTVQHSPFGVHRVLDPTGEQVTLPQAARRLDASPQIAPDEVRRSRLAQVAGAFWREGDGWRIVCFRSVGTYVETLLRNAAGEVLVRQEHGF